MGYIRVLFDIEVGEGESFEDVGSAIIDHVQELVDPEHGLERECLRYWAGVAYEVDESETLVPPPHDHEVGVPEVENAWLN